MNNPVRLSLIVAALSASAMVQAQQSPYGGNGTAAGNPPLTRAQVQAELRDLEAHGYRPEVNDYYYPNNVQTAQKRVDIRDGAVPADPSLGPAASNPLNHGY